MKRFFVKILAMLLTCIFVISGINFSIFASDTISPGNLGDRLVAMNVAITGRIKLWFYFADTQNVQRYVVEIPGEDSRTVYVSNMAESVKNGDTRRVLEVSLAAAQQAVKVKVTPYAADGTAGMPRKYSVMDYANQVIDLAATNSSYKEAAEALKSMLNYGAMSQLAFDRYTDVLANKGLYFGETNPINNMSIDDVYGVEKMEKSATNPLALDLGNVNAYLKDTISLKFYLNYTCNKSALRVTIEDQDCGNEINSDETGDYILIDNIPATKFNYQYTVKVSDGSNTLTFKCSVLNYVKSLIAMDGTADAEEYGITEADINAAYSMFQYYVKMWEYANKGTAEAEPVGKPASTTCDHKRSYVDTKRDYAEICSDCGKDVTPTNIVENANDLANGVTAYFGKQDGTVDGNRENYVVKNAHANVYYPLTNTQKQNLTITNKNGDVYVQDTMDVYVQTENGTYWSSNSTRDAIANIYRYGYYYYDIHAYGQNFLDGNATGKPVEGVEKTYLLSGFVTRTGNRPTNYKYTANVVEMDCSNASTAWLTTNPYLNLTISGTADPQVYTTTAATTEYSLATYNAVQITMTLESTSQVQLRYTTESGSSAYNDTNMLTFDTKPGTHTYTVYFNKNEGSVYGLRLDFNGKSGENITISGIKFVKIDLGTNAPDLLLDRGFHTYTDKMHQAISIVAPKNDVENISEIGMVTKIEKNTVGSWIVKSSGGTSQGTNANTIDVSNVEYAGFYINGVGVFGYILPAVTDNDGDGNADHNNGTIVITTETIEGVEYYVITQEITDVDTIYGQPTLYQTKETRKVYDENGNVVLNADGTEKTITVNLIDEVAEKYGDDSIGTSLNIYNSPTQFYFGQRIYTDTNDNFNAFLEQAYIERNPLTAENIKIDTDKTPNATFDGYDAIRGMYAFTIPENVRFGEAHYFAENFHGEVSFSIKGDGEYDRNIYAMAYSYGCTVEGGAVMDKDDTQLPIPTEVSKNFDHEFEEPIWLWGDIGYSEVRIPVYVNKNETQKLTVVQLYKNWGQYPLKQISSIQFFAPYYHLSTGVTESNCIANYYVMGKDLQTLPDHRAASGKWWANDDTKGGDPQHDNGGYHYFLQYTSTEGKVASEPINSVINSSGPTYADIDMTYVTDDNNIEVTYKHMEMPQLDENRAYYTMQYTVKDNITINEFYKNFSFYSVAGYGGGYAQLGYLGTNGEVAGVDTNTSGTKYELGTNCPYFDMYDIQGNDGQTQNANVSFLILNSFVDLNADKKDDGVNFAVYEKNGLAALTLNIEGTQKIAVGATITINAIIMPWGDETSDPDQNVRDVRENTLLAPIVAKGYDDNTTEVENVFLPTVKSEDGLDATFTIRHNNTDSVELTDADNINVTFRVDGFKVLATPKLYEQVDTEAEATYKDNDGKYWKIVEISSANSPDGAGYAHNYDGYAVHYNSDGTYSYSFVTTITGEAERTFKVVVDDTYVYWEKIPFDMYYDADAIYLLTQASDGSAGINTDESKGNVAKVLYDEDNDVRYARLYGNGTSAEMSLNLKMYGSAAGRYLTIKYRINSSYDPKSFQAYLISDGSSGHADSSMASASSLVKDGTWQIAVIDLSQYSLSMVDTAADGSSYSFTSCRLDVFNLGSAISNDAYIDIAYVAFCSDLNDTVKVNSGKVENMAYIVGPSSSQSLSEKLDVLNKFSNMNVVFSGSELYSQMFGGSMDGLTSENVKLNNGIVTTTGKGNVGIFVGGKIATGQYMVIKYRTSSAPTAGKFNVYTSAGDNIIENDYKNLSYSYGFIGDGKWHTLVMDLSAASASKPDAYTVIPDTDGKYYINWVRLDALSLCFADTSEIEFEYIGFCDELSDVVIDEDVYADLGWQKWAASVDKVSIDGEVKVDATPVDKGGLGNGYSTSCNNGIQNHPFGTSIDCTVFAANGWLAIDGHTVSDFSYCVTDAEGVEHWYTVEKDGSGANRWREASDITPHATKSTAQGGLGYSEKTVGYRWYLDIDLSAYAGQTVTLSMRAITDGDTAVTTSSVVVNIPSNKELDVIYKGEDLVDMMTDNAGNEGDKGISSVVPNADGTVTVKYDGSNDRYFSFELDGSVATGQYLVIKYRTGLGVNVADNGSVKCLASTSADKSYTGHLKLATIVADHKWHTLVIKLEDLASVTASNGSHYVTLVRVDLFDALTANGTVDFAYVGLCDDLGDIVLGANEYLEYGWQNWTSSFDSLTIDGTKVTNKDSAANKHLEPSAGASDRYNSYTGGKWAWSGWFAVDGQNVTDISVCVTDEAGKEHWTSFGTPTARSDLHNDNYKHAESVLGYASGTICYKVAVDADLSAFYSQTVNVSVRAITEDGFAVTIYSVFVDVPLTAAPQWITGAELQNYAGSKYTTELNDDGSLTLTAKAAGDNFTDWFTPEVSGVAAPKYAIIRYMTKNETSLGMYARTTSGAEYVKLSQTITNDEKWHTVVFDLTSSGQYFVDEEITHIRIDPCCNTTGTITIDYIYLFNSISDINLDYDVDILDSSSTSLSSSLGTKEGTLESLKITSNGAGETRFTVNIPSGTTFGKYVVLRYRYASTNVNNGNLMYLNTWTSTTNSGATAGDNQRVNVFADGQWHTVVIDVSKNATVTANADDTYSLKYLSFDVFMGASAYDGDYLEISYIGFSDDLTEIIDECGEVEYNAGFVYCGDQIGSTHSGYTSVLKTYTHASNSITGWAALDGTIENMYYKIVSSTGETEWIQCTANVYSKYTDSSAHFDSASGTARDLGFVKAGEYVQNVVTHAVPASAFSTYASGEVVTLYIAASVDGLADGAYVAFVSCEITIP